MKRNISITYRRNTFYYEDDDGVIKKHDAPRPVTTCTSSTIQAPSETKLFQRFQEICEQAKQNGGIACFVSPALQIKYSSWAQTNYLLSKR